jgi:hypothetical protein
VVCLLGFLLAGLVVASSGGQAPVALGFLVLLVMGAAALLGALGVGQATAALRTRGGHMILATIGLVLSGLFVGTLIGLMGFAMWMS